MLKAMLTGLAAACVLGLFAAKLPFQEPVEEPKETAPAVELAERREERKAPEAHSRDQSYTITMQCGDETTTLPVDEYLTGVILAEMPPAFENEALKAQAVAARTLACRRMTLPKHETAAVCNQAACCQAYLSPAEAEEKLGADWEKWTTRVRTAIEETDGLVMRYQGELIDAVFFSSSGGATEAAAAVWGGEVPYLQSVESPDGGERFTERVRVPVQEFRAVILRETPEAGLEGEPAGWFGPVRRTAGGGVACISIGGVEYSGTVLRRLFCLRSACFTVSVEGEEIVFETRGSGHRVGMSQYGAQAMALNGADFREILAHYYQNVEIDTIDP